MCISLHLLFSLPLVKVVGMEGRCWFMHTPAPCGFHQNTNPPYSQVSATGKPLHVFLWYYLVFVCVMWKTILILAISETRISFLQQQQKLLFLFIFLQKAFLLPYVVAPLSLHLLRWCLHFPCQGKCFNSQNVLESRWKYYLAEKAVYYFLRCKLYLRRGFTDTNVI